MTSILRIIRCISKYGVKCNVFSLWITEELNVWYEIMIKLTNLKPAHFQEPLPDNMEITAGPEISTIYILQHVLELETNLREVSQSQRGRDGRVG